jgi:hypothetical protein
MRKLLLGGAAAAMALWIAQPAAADPIFGTPADDLFGCDSPLGGHCAVTFDENGNIKASFHSFFVGDVASTAKHVASTVDPTYVDSTGAPLEVTSYTLQVAEWNTGGFAPFFSGSVGICEFALGADGACAGPTGDDKSDVVIFKFNPDDNKLHIDYLSDNESVFRWATDFNVLEVGPEGHNGAFYHSLGDTGGGEDIFYHFVSDGSIPEPGTWALMLLGFGGLGAAFRRRRIAFA